MKIQIKNSLLLVITALIWGIAFVAQSTGGDAIGAFSFNGIRSFIGAIVLVPVIVIVDKIKEKSSKYDDKNIKKWRNKSLWIAGVICGTALFMASSLQQLGINKGTDAGKAGFITACYILIVPIMGIFLKRKCGWNVWIGVVIALVGLYMLMFGEKMDNAEIISEGDILLLGCAFLFSVQILAVDYYSDKVDGVRLSCLQFLVCGIFSVPFAIVSEVGITSESISSWINPFTDCSTWIPILYAGIMSCGVAYTLQIIGQRNLNPTVASLIMSLESVFSVLAGWIILGQKLSGFELSGCGLVFVAIVLAQIKPGRI